MKKLLLAISPLFPIFSNAAIAQSWENILSTDNEFLDIQFADDNTLYLTKRIIGYELLKSSDKGDTWDVKQNIDLGFFSIKGILPKNADTLLLHSTFLSPVSYDGLNILDTLSNPSTSDYSSHFEWQDDNLFLTFNSNDSAYLYQSSDAGQSWNYINYFKIYEPSSPAYFGFLYTFRNADTGYFYNYFDRTQLGISTDGGSTVSYIDIIGERINDGIETMKLHSSNNYLYMISNWGDVSYRLNITTMELSPIIDPTLDTLTFIDMDFYESTVYGLLSSGELVYSDDNGANWSIDTTFSSPTSLSISPRGDIAVSTYESLFLKEKTPTSTTPSITDANYNIYPNPTKDRLHIDMLTNTMDATFTIINILGKVLLETNETPIDCHTLSPGTYLLQIQTPSDGSSMHKFIKE